MGNKIANKIVKHDKISKNVEEIVIPPDKKRRNIEWMKASIIKMEYYNISIITQIEWIKWIEVNDLLGNEYSVNKNVRFKTPMLKSNLCDCSNVYTGCKRGNNCWRH